MSADLAAAEEFILREARLLDRHRFMFRFRGGPSTPVVAALSAYQNADGGFGNALEPDIRGVASQPVPTEHALYFLDEVDVFDTAIVSAVCDWLASVSTNEAGLPFVLDTVIDGPHAGWWVPTAKASLNPTAGIAGLLHKHGVEHEWLPAATDFCWRALADGARELGGDDSISVLTFLEYVPERDRAEQAFAAVADRIRDELVALDPATEGYVKMPLEFAPHPARLARRLFDDATIELHLDALASKQQEDGGWPITWEPPSVAAVSEWRAYVTIKWLDVLDNYGRLVPS